MAIIAACQVSCHAADRGALPRYDFIPFTGTNGLITHMSPNGQWITTSDGTVLKSGRIVGKFTGSPAQVTDTGIIRWASRAAGTTLAIPQLGSISNRTGFAWRMATFQGATIRDINTKGQMVGYAYTADGQPIPGVFGIDGSRTIFPYQRYLPVRINNRGDSLWRYAEDGYVSGMFIVTRKGEHIPILNDIVDNRRNQTSFSTSRAVAGTGRTPNMNAIYYYWDPDIGTKILSTKTRLFAGGVIRGMQMNETGMLVAEKLNPDTVLIWPDPRRDQTPFEINDRLAPKTLARYTMGTPVAISNEGVIALWGHDNMTKKPISGLLIPVRR
ncbi:MAG TPA: hypothetical protein VGM51_02990 [Armatimonadota bacterium]